MPEHAGEEVRGEGGSQQQCRKLNNCRWWSLKAAQISFGTPRAERLTALVVMGNPYLVSDLPDTAACLCTYSECPDSVEAAVMALYGEMQTTGKLPVTTAGRHAYRPVDD